MDKFFSIMHIFYDANAICEALNVSPLVRN